MQVPPMDEEDDAPHANEERWDGSFRIHAQGRGGMVEEERRGRELHGNARQGREGVIAWREESSNFSYLPLWPAPSLNR